jgi:hypothetical protein
LLTRPVYVYFGEFLYKLDKPARMHWDRIAINPKDSNGNLLTPSTAETFCLGQPNNTCPAATPPPPPPSPPPSGTRKSGDVDRDGDVDLNDLSLIITRYGTADPDADFDGGGVGLSDLSLVLVNYGK